MLKKEKNNVSYKTKKSLITATLCPLGSKPAFLAEKPEGRRAFVGVIYDERIEGTFKITLAIILKSEPENVRDEITEMTGDDVVVTDSTTIVLAFDTQKGLSSLPQ